MNSKNRIAIQLIHIGKKYEIHHEKPTLIEKFVKGRNETFWALRDINLTIKKGERLGIIGPNGSGKTTLLKIMAGITTPTTGTVHTQGKIVSLIELNSGFQEDLTGEQNIYVNGMLLGMSKTEIRQKLKRIIDFADIRQFVDTPIFTYSFGMKLRLGFSIAVHADPDILLLDENLSVGDSNFQNKSEHIIKHFFGKNITTIIISHYISLLEKNCQRIVVLDQGHLHTYSQKILKKKYS